MSAEVGDGDLAAWRRVIEVNYLGLLAGCHVMTPWLKASALLAKNSSSPNSRLATRNSQLPPAIINIASVTAFLPAPAMGAYASSKAAVIALSEAMYAELRPHGVHVTVVAPGFFRTRCWNAGRSRSAVIGRRPSTSPAPPRSTPPASPASRSPRPLTGGCTLSRAAALAGSGESKD